MDKWHVKYCAEPNEETNVRVSLMKQLSITSSIFPELQFVYENNCITQYSKHIDAHKWPDDIATLSLIWEHFEKSVFEMHQLNYVHGDILKKNIVFDGTRFRLIDHELVLFHKNQLRATYPWIAPEDFIAKQLTSKTDLICLKATALRLFDDVKYKEFRMEQVLIISPFYSKF